MLDVLHSAFSESNIYQVNLPINQMSLGMENTDASLLPASASLNARLNIFPCTLFSAGVAPPANSKDKKSMNVLS